MPPRRELNDRFKGYLARSRRTRRLVATSFVVTCLLVGSGLAVEMAPPNALAAVRSSIASLANDLSAAPGSFSNSSAQADQQLAATAGSGVGDFLFRIICTLLRTCPAEPEPQFSENQKSQHTSTSQNAKQPAATPQRQPPTRSTTGRTTGTLTTSAVGSSPPPPQAIQQVISQPVIERIREVRTVESGTSAAYVDVRMLALQQSLQSQIAAVAATGIRQDENIYQTLGMVARIDNLDDVNITNSRISGATITGGSIAASTITGTISNIIDAATATIADLTATTITTTNSTTTNIAVTGTARIGSATGILQTTSGVVSAIALGGDGQVLKIVGGTPSWSTDITGSGGGAGAWATTSNNLAIVESDATDVVVIGAAATSTTGNILEVAGNALFRNIVTVYQTITAPSFTATSSQANILPFASSTAISVSGAAHFGTASTTALTISNSAGGILKTNASGVVSVATAGTDYVAGVSGDWTGTLDGFEASTLIANAFSTTSANYWESQQSARTADDLTNNSIENLSDVADGITENYGDLFAWNGGAWMDFATSSLAIALADTTGTLGATRGGTGLSSVAAAGILVGNYAGTGWLQLATSTLGLLTTHVAEGSNLYWTDVRFDARLAATTSLPNLTTLANLSLPATQLSNFGAPFYQFFAATTTSALAEGSNLYYLDSRAQSFIHSSSTIPKTYASNTWTGSQIFSGSILAQGTAQFTNSSTFFGQVSVGATGTTTIATDGTISTPSITANSSTATSSFAGGIAGPGNFVIESSTGRLGIGTTSPDFPLSLYAATGAFARFTAGAGSQSGLILDGDREYRLIMKGNESDQFAIRDVTAGADRLTIDTGGNIGIGTTTPNFTLDVNGRIAGIVFDRGGRAIDVRAYGATGDCSTDDTSAIQSAIDAAATSSTIYIPSTNSCFVISSPLNISKPLTIAGTASSTLRTTQNIAIISISSSNVQVRDLVLLGPSGTSYNASSVGVYASGVSAPPGAPTFITNVAVENVHASRFGYAGIYLRLVDGFRANSNTVSNADYAGILIVSGKNGRITHNDISQINGSGTPGSNAYGIVITRNNGSSGELTSQPRSQNITVTGNTVRDIPTWEGIDTHGGQSITFANNTIVGAYKGIAIGPSDDSGGTPTYAPLDVTVTGNVVASGVTDGSAEYGIAFVGAGTVGSPVQLATGAITGNRVAGHGNGASNSSGGIYLAKTTGLTVAGNAVSEASPSGINLHFDNYYIAVTGNSIVDPWTNSGVTGYAAGIFASQYNYGTFSGNTVATSSKAATYTLSSATGYGIYLNSVPQGIQVGVNYIFANTRLQDTSRQASTYFAANLGIGTTSPNDRLVIADSVSGTIAASGGTDTSQLGTIYATNVSAAGVGLHFGVHSSDGAFWLQSRSASNYATNFNLLLNPNGGNVGIGTTSPYAALSVTTPGSGGPFTAAHFENPRNADSNHGLIINNRRNNSTAKAFEVQVNSATQFLVRGDGIIGVGPTTTPWRTLSVTGTVAFDGLTGSTGAGSLCLDSNKQVVYNSGSDACLSSTRATKDEIAPLSLDDLAIVGELEPVSFVYNEGDGRTRYGFIAEDTAATDAHLATYDATGAVSGIDDRSILAIVVGAVQDLWSKVLALIASDEAQNARIQQLEAEVAALKAGAAAPEVSGTGAPAASLAHPAASSTADSNSTADDNEPQTAADAPGAPSGLPASKPPNADTAIPTTPHESAEAAGATTGDGAGAPGGVPARGDADLPITVSDEIPVEPAGPQPADAAPDPTAAGDTI